jgi:hypothetical protein
MRGELEMHAPHRAGLVGPGEIDVHNLPLPKELGQFAGAKEAGEEAAVIFEGFCLDQGGRVYWKWVNYHVPALKSSKFKVQGSKFKVPVGCALRTS